MRFIRKLLFGDFCLNLMCFHLDRFYIGHTSSLVGEKVNIFDFISYQMRLSNAHCAAIVHCQSESFLVVNYGQAGIWEWRLSVLSHIDLWFRFLLFAALNIIGIWLILFRIVNLPGGVKGSQNETQSTPCCKDGWLYSHRLLELLRLKI